MGRASCMMHMSKNREGETDLKELPNVGLQTAGWLLSTSDKLCSKFRCGSYPEMPPVRWTKLEEEEAG